MVMVSSARWPASSLILLSSAARSWLPGWYCLTGSLTGTGVLETASMSIAPGVVEWILVWLHDRAVDHSVRVRQDRPRVQAFWACASGRCRSHGQQPARVLAYRELRIRHRERYARPAASAGLLGLRERPVPVARAATCAGS